MKNRIQELRKAQKVTQNELADAVDVTRQTITRNTSRFIRKW